MGSMELYHPQNENMGGSPPSRFNLVSIISSKSSEIFGLNCLEKKGARTNKSCSKYENWPSVIGTIILHPNTWSHVPKRLATSALRYPTL